jgi:aerotaxis receptor
VAGEVRSLAQRSACAAKEVEALIEDSVQKVALGNAQGGELGEVNAAMAALDAITRLNAALVEQSAAASGNVAEKTARLVQALSVFKFDPARA